MTVLTVRLDDDLAAEFTARATDRNMTKAKLIRKLIKSELAFEMMREDEAIITLDINELTVVKSALELYLQAQKTNDALQVYFYITKELAELSVSLTSRPYIL